VKIDFIDPKDAVVFQPLLILTPRRMIFKRFGRIMVFLFVAAMFSYNVLIYISIPLYVIAAYLVYELSAIWRAHRYAVSMLYFLTIVVLVIFLILGHVVRTLIFG